MKEKILTKDKIDQVAKKLDKLIDFKKIISNSLIATGAELVDGKGFEMGLNYLNDNHSDNVPERFHDNINDFIDCFIEDDYSKLYEVGQETIMELGNIKFMPDDFEAVWVMNNLKAAVLTINHIASIRK